MLSVMSTLFETIKTIVYFSIYLSYNTGKIIVYGVILTYETISALFSTLLSFLVILNEDLFVFLQDLANRLCCIVGALQNLTTYIGDLCLLFIHGIKNIYTGTVDVLTNIFYGIIHIVMKSVTGITTLIAGIKYMIVLFGSGVWFVVTLIPVFLIYVYFLITYYAGRAMDELKTLFITLINEIFTIIIDGVNFFLDVPFEAVAGLIICACLVYCLVKFQVALISSFNRIVRFILTRIREKFHRLRSWRSTVNEAENTDSDSSLDTDDSGNTEDILGPPDGIELVNNDPGWMTKRERYRQILQEESNQNCIICTEKSKCILLMPCRHLSTCKECTETLRRYQQNCPICRRYISYTIHVY